MSHNASARVHVCRQSAAITLAAGEIEATFLPELGMLGVSLRWRGNEFLSLHGGLAGYRAGHTTGIPLLYPWANRLSQQSYTWDGIEVDLEGLPIHTDPAGLPMHGTLAARPEWEVLELTAKGTMARLRVRFPFDKFADLLASFPFAHHLEIEIALEHTLSITTTIYPTGTRRVPVAFGWHPYFRLPRCRHPSIQISLPERYHLPLTIDGTPTDEEIYQEAETISLAERSFDDLYRLNENPEITLSGGGNRLSLLLKEGYRHLQVYTPSNQRRVVCLEPMTAATNSLVSGNCQAVPPGERFSARFIIACQSL